MQEAVVRGLRTHFAGRKLLAKRDDLIGVPVLLCRWEGAEDDKEVSNGNLGEDVKEPGQPDRFASDDRRSQRLKLIYRS